MNTRIFVKQKMQGLTHLINKIQSKNYKKGTYKINKNFFVMI